MIQYHLDKVSGGTQQRRGETRKYQKTLAAQILGILVTSNGNISKAVFLHQPITLSHPQPVPPPHPWKEREREEGGGEMKKLRL